MTPDQVPAWRKAERERLLAERAARPLAARQDEAAALARHLDALLAARFSGPAGLVVSGYWPIKSEPDLRPWLTALHQQGARTALPVVETRAAPLVFRPWAPGAAMERGHWNILVPADPAHIIPQVTLAPLVGWDRQGYRLGYGGGYFDRTLAALAPRPLVIGVGSQAAEIETIHPQPHDIPLDAIVTGEGVQVLRG
ncbi:5-formyltetrahydrofolate cyclo-ligase [Pseudogemmobacter humi]|uniref:5-formyltetrahydrofolate cyclo-ligase n=1 Tax=Pseudogemmobacter humi TaxID=2483812 RepID=A0A3P5XF46_9RHOB|nr:5-formyltetrahydrofolate cyclo-ligase [Pseudogemmobacter humi]VDC30003.1 putative 5-formyltetrahydrofolate cyclo-ligase [Pseudogemmobacter humi]